MVGRLVINKKEKKKLMKIHKNIITNNDICIVIIKEIRMLYSNLFQPSMMVRIHVYFLDKHSQVKQVVLNREKSSFKSWVSDKQLHMYLDNRMDN